MRGGDWGYTGIEGQLRRGRLRGRGAWRSGAGLPSGGELRDAQRGARAAEETCRPGQNAKRKSPPRAISIFLLSDLYSALHFCSSLRLFGRNAPGLRG
eukprot:CAMPEP_0172584152 /NCGR_PEP_ID=MMETSP1068-20121228/3740_1 /TAXON_ID=35684 /ORGANISM="Pseudopedinella elastica, Strain CCMP716" /LENGTH=97 /DNA_ID=CAMNT_0013378235 /DNA_START=24 /DNA_END=317 /DNA_ORIENTATION=-